MGQDVYGNYVPDVVGPPVSGGGATIALVATGVGAPDADTPTYTPIYVDTATGDVYAYSSGSWALISADVSGVTGVHVYAGNPNGNETANGPAICVQVDGGGVPTGDVWIKVSAANANTGWTKLIST